MKNKFDEILTAQSLAVHCERERRVVAAVLEWVSSMLFNSFPELLLNKIDDGQHQKLDMSVSRTKEHAAAARQTVQQQPNTTKRNSTDDGLLLKNSLSQ